jgi:Mg2+ and Co2+ transporter CorA
LCRNLVETRHRLAAPDERRENDVASTLHHRSQHLLLALTHDVARKFLDLVEGATISVRVVARSVEVCPRGVRQNRP